MPAGPAQCRAAHAADGDADRNSDEQLEGGVPGALGVFQAGGGGGAGDGQHHHGRGDAVVEAALDGDELTDP